MHILCNSIITKISEHFKLFTQRLQKLRGKKCQELTILNFLRKCSLQECQLSKNFSVITFLISSIENQQGTYSLKILSHSDHIRKIKSRNMCKDILKLAINTLISKNPLRKVNLRIQSEYEKIRTRKNSVFGHFSHSDS